MIKSLLASLIFLIYFSSHTVFAQSADIIYLFDGKVVAGEIKKPAYPLRNSKVDINTDFGQQSFFLDQIDSVKKDGVTYKKLSYRLGREAYQSLGKPYFKGDWNLYETEVRQVIPLQIMEVDSVSYVLTEDNYWATIRTFLNDDFEGPRIKEFNPILISQFSEEYHNQNGRIFSDAIIQEKKLSDIRYGFGLGFNSYAFDNASGLRADGSSGLSFNLLFALERFQFEANYRFDKMRVFANVNSKVAEFDVRKNEFALLTNFLLIKDKEVKPYLQAGFLFMGEKIDGDVSASTSLLQQGGSTTFTYDGSLNVFLGGGLYFDFQPIGFGINYRRTPMNGTVVVLSSPQQFELNMNTISLTVYF